MWTRSEISLTPTLLMKVSVLMVILLSVFLYREKGFTSHFDIVATIYCKSRKYGLSNVYSVFSFRNKLDRCVFSSNSIFKKQATLTSSQIIFDIHCICITSKNEHSLGLTVEDDTKTHNGYFKKFKAPLFCDAISIFKKEVSSSSDTKEAVPLNFFKHLNSTLMVALLSL